MEQSTIVQLFEACKPLIKKLGVDEYDYCFDVADLSILPIIDQLIQHLTACSESDLPREAMTSDISERELWWLMTFYDMRETLQEYVKQEKAEQYYPFRQRLKAIDSNIQYFLNCGIMKHSDDHEILLMASMAEENPLYLSLAEKALAHVNAEVGGDPAPKMTRTDLILIYELRLLYLKYGVEFICPSDYRKPSEVKREEWLLAQQRGTSFTSRNRAKTGRWTIFASTSDIDQLWKRISRATTNGQLGIAAQVSTARPKKTQHTQEYVLYVYTKDYQDQDDVFRVRSSLATLGVTQQITYRPEKSSSKDAKPQAIYTQ